MSADPNYDIILFGVTGFTGKLAVEYLLKKKYDIKWAASARNQTKAEKVLSEIAERVGEGTQPPPLLTVDLVCKTPEEEEALRGIVRQTKVVLTCSGPFEKYGTTLVKVCAELGVSYADITGETDFFRSMIQNYDGEARKTGATIVCHCGNDCIPQDLLVYEMNKFALSKGAELREVTTYCEFADEASFSGGTLATATYQLSKDRTKVEKPSFDPLLQTEEGSKSEFATKNISPKADVPGPPEFECKAGPWIMGPVMVNAVRRSNALLHYSKTFRYGDSQLKKSQSWGAYVKKNANAGLLAGSIAFPSVFQRFLPNPGEGPSRAAMEAGWFSLHGRGVMQDVSTEDAPEIKLESKFHFNKDIAYLYTAWLIVETGVLLVEKKGISPGGVLTPAVALGSDLTGRILKKLDSSLEIKSV